MELKNASVDDLVALIQAAFAKAGKPAPEIALAPSWTAERRKEVVWKELRLRNAPVEVLLQYACSMTYTGWDYRDGIIEITPTMACWGVRRRCACGAFITDENGKLLPGEH
ncbi:MAG: hypothetical protein QM755_14335 [Luteolibacter sp.]